MLRGDSPQPAPHRRSTPPDRNRQLLRAYPVKCRRVRPPNRKGLLVLGDDPHCEVLSTAAVRVTESRARAVDLMLTRLTHHLQRGLSKADHPGRADGVGRQETVGLNGDESTVVPSGTSLAAAHVAGVAAIYKACHVDAAPDEVRTALLAAAETVSIEDVDFSLVSAWEFDRNSCRDVNHDA